MSPFRLAPALLLAAALLFAHGAPARAEGGAAAPPAPPPAETVEAEGPAEGTEAAEAPATEEGEAAAVEAGLEEEAALSIEEYEALLQRGPLTRWSLILLKVLPILLGAGFLVAGYVSWNRRQARRGAAGTGRPEDAFGEATADAPLPAPTAPPDGPTPPWPPLTALGVTALALVLGVVMGQAVLAVPFLPEGGLLTALVAQGLMMMPLALLVVLKRIQLRAGRRTPLWRAAGRGFVAFSVGSAVAFPLAILGLSVLTAVGEKPAVQDVVLRATDPEAPANLWLIAVVGIVVAPFTEEAIFRGLFFPAMRRALGGRRGAFWVSAVVISLLFAAIHMNAYALLPLFGLAMVLSWVMEKTDSLSTAMLGHAFYNASTMVPLLIARLEGVV